MFPLCKVTTLRLATDKTSSWAAGLPQSVSGITFPKAYRTSENGRIAFSQDATLFAKHVGPPAAISKWSLSRVAGSCGSYSMVVHPRMAKTMWRALLLWMFRQDCVNSFSSPLTSCLIKDFFSSIGMFWSTLRRVVIRVVTATTLLNLSSSSAAPAITRSTRG
jgi:hypothetical protein